MSATSDTLKLRSATRDDLAEIHALTRECLVLDAFSQDLLAEKLFQNPHPDEYAWGVLLAESGGRLAGIMQSVASSARKKAWVGLFAVRDEFRRRGVASRLLDAIAAIWPPEIAEVEVLAIPGNYFTPGLDPRYTEALCFLERRGFERFRDCVNLIAPLDHRFETDDEEARLAKEGIAVRRAGPDDRALLDAFFAGDFGADWRYEAELAMRVDPPALHLALRNDEIIAFSAHSTQNREWGFFGPMGTTPAARGHGLGRVLLWHCLNDMRAAGHRTSVIPWVGPTAFYHQWCAARVERVFWRYMLRR